MSLRDVSGHLLRCANIECGPTFATQPVKVVNRAPVEFSSAQSAHIVCGLRRPIPKRLRVCFSLGSALLLSSRFASLSPLFLLGSILLLIGRFGDAARIWALYMISCAPSYDETGWRADPDSVWSVVGQKGEFLATVSHAVKSLITTTSCRPSSHAKSGDVVQ